MVVDCVDDWGSGLYAMVSYKIHWWKNGNQQTDGHIILVNHFPDKIAITNWRRNSYPSAKTGRLSIIGVVADVVRTERVRGLWKGVTPSVVRTVPGVGLYFSVLHTMKTNLDISQVRVNVALDVQTYCTVKLRSNEFKETNHFHLLIPQSNILITIEI